MTTQASGSVARGSMARFGGGIASAFFGLLVGVLTARYLGATNKGALSTLTYLVALTVPLCGLGLGEAGQVLVGRGRATLQRATSATVAALALSSVFGMLLFGAVVSVLFPADLPDVDLAVVAAAATLPLIVLVTALSKLLDAADEVVFVSGVRVWTAFVTALGTVLLVYQLDRATTGALVAVSLGWSTGLIMILVRLAKLGVRPLPRWDSGFLRAAVPHGLPVQISSLVIVASTRVDLLFVGALAGAADAGRYSVALTVGQLVVYAPVALATAAGPAITRLPEDEVRGLVARLCRAAVATGLLTALLLAAASPLLIPFAFGSAFREAVAPALILLLGGVLWGAQWAACRSEAARGRPRVLLVSYTVALAVMVIGDVLLIEAHGLAGAAWASTASSFAGWAVAVAWPGTVRVTPRPSGFLPRRSDVAYGLATLGQALGKRRRPEQAGPQSLPDPPTAHS